MILADEKGNVIDGDQILAILGTRMLASGQLPGKTVVATVMSNLGLERALDARNGKLIRTAVGDRYVVEAMRESGFMLGGEQSGHIVFLDHATTGDGIIAALRVLAVMVREQKPLSELASTMTRYPQVLLNFAVDAEAPLRGDAVGAEGDREGRERAGQGRACRRPLLGHRVEGARDDRRDRRVWNPRLRRPRSRTR